MLAVIYVLGSFVSSIGVILAVIAFAKDFKDLSFLQKLSLIFIVLGVLVPFLAGFINGIFNH